MSFDDNTLVPLLFGQHNAHLHYIENVLDVDISSRGNEVAIKGQPKALRTAETVLEMLWEKIKREQDVSVGEVDAAIRFAKGEKIGMKENNPHASRETFFDEKAGIKTGGSGTGSVRVVTPRSPNQSAYIEAIKKNDMVFGIGPAGTGKTYLAVAAGVELFKQGDVKRLVFCRPAVEAGERLGFLPGDMMEKIDPYLRPIYDALHDFFPADVVLKKIAAGDIEIAPLAFMRGRTLKDAFVVLDEAQNTTAMQMKMFLTRMGEGTRMVITGDPTQIDLPPGTQSGLKEAINILHGIKEVSFTHFNEKDVVRHKLVGKIIEAYNNYELRGSRRTD
jgi:phosphate starvation-inducible PhoH-like protein